MLDDDSELKHFAVVRNREQIEMIDLGKRPQHWPINRRMRNALDVRGYHLERREAVHQRPYVILVHDDEVPERILRTRSVDCYDAGLELFDGSHNALTVDCVAGQVEGFRLRRTFKDDPGGLSE